MTVSVNPTVAGGSSVNAVTNTSGNLTGLSGSFGTVNIQQVLSQAGIPMVLIGAASTSTIAISSTGGLTLSTALPFTIQPGFWYFPAGQINSSGAGAAAGWYWVVMSNTTTGTVYNNVYTPGVVGTPGSGTLQASVPTSLVGFSGVTGSAGFTQTTGSQIPGFTYCLAGNSLGLNGRWEFEGTYLMTANTDSKAINMSFGGSSQGTTTISTASSEVFLDLMRGSQNMNGTGSQISRNSGTQALFNSSAPAVTSIDTTQNQLIANNLELVSISASTIDYLVLLAHKLVLYPN